MRIAERRGAGNRDRKGTVEHGHRIPAASYSRSSENFGLVDTDDVMDNTVSIGVSVKCRVLEVVRSRFLSRRVVVGP